MNKPKIPPTASIWMENFFCIEINTDNTCSMHNNKQASIQLLTTIKPKIPITAAINRESMLCHKTLTVHGDKDNANRQNKQAAQLALGQNSNKNIN